MESIQQVLVQGINGGRTVSVDVVSKMDQNFAKFISVRNVQECIADKLQIPSERLQQFTLTLSTRRKPLASHELLDITNFGSVPPTFRLSIPLLGGKGGFGSLLRTAQVKVGTKRTEDKGAMRDLSGRRVRHVETEKQLKEWASKPAPEKKNMAKIFKNIKDGKIAERQPCRWGDKCKYKWKCRGYHPSDIEAEERKRKGFSLTQQFGKNEDTSVIEQLDGSELQEEVEDAVAAGLKAVQAKMQTKGKRKAPEGESKDKDADPSASASASNGVAGDDEEQPEPPSDDEGEDDNKKEKANGTDELKGLTEDGDLDFESLARPKFKKQRVNGPSSSSSSSNSSTSRNSSSHSGPSLPFASMIPSSSLSVITHAAATSLSATGEDMKVELTELSARTQANSEANAEADRAAAEAASLAEAAARNHDFAKAAAKSYNNNNSTSNGSSPAAPTEPTVNLSEYKTAQELESIGGDTLKAELTRLGLKCGGTVAERAGRLFMLKTTPLNKLPKKLFAK